MLADALARVERRRCCSTPARQRWSSACEAASPTGSCGASPPRRTRSRARVDVDGRGPSIWDTYSHTPGKIDNGDTGDVACDHYRRWREDVDLIGALGVNAYRFSIAWPRIFPTGRGPLEQRGLDHYSRLIDALLERGHRAGRRRSTTGICRRRSRMRAAGATATRSSASPSTRRRASTRYGDRVRWWLTINEPWIVGLLGYLHGLHAPGYKDDVRGEVTVFHHLLLAHGRAVQALPRVRAGREDRDRARTSRRTTPRATTRPTLEVTRASDGYVNRWFLDPRLPRHVPRRTCARATRSCSAPLDFVRDGDLDDDRRRRPTTSASTTTRSASCRPSPGDTPWPWRVVVPEDVPTTGGFTGGRREHRGGDADRARRRSPTCSSASATTTARRRS